MLLPEPRFLRNLLTCLGTVHLVGSNWPDASLSTDLTAAEEIVVWFVFACAAPFGTLFPTCYHVAGTQPTVHCVISIFGLKYGTVPAIHVVARTRTLWKSNPTWCQRNPTAYHWTHSARHDVMRGRSRHKLQDPCRPHWRHVASAQLRFLVNTLMHPFTNCYSTQAKLVRC